MTVKENSTTYVLVITVLFGIIIGISLTDYQKELVPLEFNFETVMILVAFATVMTSFVGYSIAIKNRYHKNIWRFVLDIFLLYLYYQLVYSPQNGFGYFLWIFPMIFGIYVIWQYLEYLEWKDETGTKSYKSEDFEKIIGGTILFTFVFFLIALLYDGSITLQDTTDGILNYRPVTIVEILILGTLIGLIIGFRVFVFKVSK